MSHELKYRFACMQNEYSEWPDEYITLSFSWSCINRCVDHLAMPSIEPNALWWRCVMSFQRQYPCGDRWEPECLWEIFQILGNPFCSHYDLLTLSYLWTGSFARILKVSIPIQSFNCLSFVTQQLLKVFLIVLVRAHRIKWEQHTTQLELFMEVLKGAIWSESF